MNKTDTRDESAGSARAELGLSSLQVLVEEDKHTEKRISDDGLSYAATVVRGGVSRDSNDERQTE